MLRLFIIISICFLLTACAVFKRPIVDSLGEKTSGFGYIPLDGLAVEQDFADSSCVPWRDFVKDKSRSIFSSQNELSGIYTGKDPYKPLLESLPDISVRFAVASFDNNNGLIFGPAKITTKYANYRAVLDYVNVDVIPSRFWITGLDNFNKPVKLSSNHMRVVAYEVLIASEEENDSKPPHAESELITIPIYVGVGMRLSADITALESGIPLMSLGAIGVEAQAKNLAGTLSVQTIGITGESVATSLPLPSKLDQTTIENGILSIGSNRAVVYRNQPDGAYDIVLNTNSGVTITPRVVGLYSPIGSSPVLINAIYSELAKKKPRWSRPCRALPK